VAVRARGGVDLGVMPLATFSERLRLEVERRSNSPGEGGGTAARDN